MKHMKKILLVAALLTAMTARAQMTPEAIMGSVPTMPSTAEMLQYYSDYTNPNGEGVPDPNAISNFLEAWEEARRNIDANNKTGDVIQRRVMNSKVGNGTNKSVKEVENMSDAEAEAMAKATMNKQLAGYGISQKDLARMQSGQMSEAEMAALQRTLDMLRFKCWYYETAIRDGGEEGIQAMLPDHLPPEIQELYDSGHR